MKEIIDILNSQPFYGGDEWIEIAKGKYSIPKDTKGWWNKIKRYCKNKLIK